jgi:Mg-chelatase subunit ChlD
MKQTVTLFSYLLCILFLNFIFPERLHAQTKNLVENPSFEDYTYPVIRNWPGATQPGQEILPGWVTPTRGTADFYNSNLSVCDGFSIAKARTGEGRVAMILGLGIQNQPAMNYKEYVQGKFMIPLEAGKKYCVKFYVALDHASPYTTTGIGAYISSDPVRSNYKEPLPVVPQIISHQLITSENGWVQISGTYIAKGGERFITLGSFSDTSVVSLSSLGKWPEKPLSSSHIMRSAYFYMDDVSVTPDDGANCDCSLKKADDRPGDYFLFLIDISGSMNKSGKLDLMKSEIKDFTQGLNENNKIGIMAFSDNAKILLPFLGPQDSVRIDTTIDHLKSHGVTNGDLAIHRVSEIIDSMHLPQRTHVIIATDGIFNVTELTKNYADSVLNKNNTSFCVLQFGSTTNTDLEELTEKTPQGSYNYVNKHSAPKIIEAQLPPPLPDISTVFYTDMGKAVGTEMIENILIDMTR